MKVSKAGLHLSGTCIVVYSKITYSSYKSKQRLLQQAVNETSNEEVRPCILRANYPSSATRKVETLKSYQPGYVLPMEVTGTVRFANLCKTFGLDRSKPHDEGDLFSQKPSSVLPVQRMNSNTSGISAKWSRGKHKRQLTLKLIDMKLTRVNK